MCDVVGGRLVVISFQMAVVLVVAVDGSAARWSSQH